MIIILRKLKTKRISRQSKAKIQEVTLSMVTFSQKETTTKNASKPL